MKALLAQASQDPTVHLTSQARIVAAIVAIVFMAFILDLIRRHRIQERYSVVWFLSGLAMLVGAAFPAVLELIADAMGVRDTNVALFSLMILLLLGLALNFSVIVSRQAEQITRLAQERALERSREAERGGDGASPEVARQTPREREPD